MAGKGGLPPDVVDSIATGSNQETKDILNYALYNEPDWDTEVIGNGLVRLFGDWIKTIYDGSMVDVSSSLITDVFTYSNYIAMILFIFLVIYIGWSAVIKTAADGQVLGKNWSPVWLPLRTGVAMALMYPMSVTSSGEGANVKVSTVQNAVIYLAMVGSEIADKEAELIYDKLPVKGIVNINSSMLGVDKYPVDIMANLICHNTMNIDDFDEDDNVKYYLERSQMKSSSSALSTNTLPYMKFEELSDALSKARDLLSYSDVVLLMGGNTAYCGKVYFRKGVQTSSDGSSFDDAMENSDPGEALSDFITKYRQNWERQSNTLVNNFLMESLLGFDEMAKAIAETESETYEDALKINDFTQSIENGYTIGSVTHQFIEKRAELINDFRTNVKNIANASTANGALKHYFDYMKTKGWAGLYGVYFGIGQVGEIFPKSLEKSIEGRVYVDIAPSRKGGYFDQIADSLFSFFISNEDAEFTDRIHNNLVGQINLIRRALANSNDLDTSPSSIASCSDKGDCQVNEEKFKSGVKTQLNGSGLFDALTSRGGDESTDLSGSVFPVATLQNFGSTLVNIGTVSHGISVTMYALASSLGATSATSMLFGEAKGAARGLLIGGPLMIAMAVGTMGFTLGIFLTYVLPMMPTLIGIMMIAGYFVMIIEAYGASPLAVVQMATPEGEGISGTRMERAISILAALLLTPSLNVMGFIASITMLFVMFPIYNEFFWTAYNLVIQADSAGMFGAGNGLLDIFVAITLYVGGLTTLIRFCYMIMPTLKQHILEWFSSGAARAFGENESAQKMEHVGQEVNSGTQSLQNNIQGFARIASRAKKSEKQKPDEKVNPSEEN